MGVCVRMITLCLSTQTAPYNSHRRHCTADREPYSSLSTPVRSLASRLVVNTHRVKHHGVLLVQQLPKARVRALSRNPAEFHSWATLMRSIMYEQGLRKVMTGIETAPEVRTETFRERTGGRAGGISRVRREEWQAVHAAAASDI